MPLVTRRVLPFYRRAEAWADLVRQRAVLYLKNKELECPSAAHPHRQEQQGVSDVHQGGMNCPLQQQKLAEREAIKELLAMPVSMLAQLLVQSPHLFVDPESIRGREELQWQLRELSLIHPTTMLAAVSEGVAYHHAGKLGSANSLFLCLSLRLSLLASTHVHLAPLAPLARRVYNGWLPLAFRVFGRCKPSYESSGLLFIY